MKIVFTAKGNTKESEMDPRFGRAPYLLVYNDETKEEEWIDTTSISEAGHGAGPRMAKTVMDLNADVIVTGNGPGGKAAQVLERSSIKIFAGAADGSVQNAIDGYLAGKFKEFSL